MSNVLHISGLNKSYNGRKVVDNISLDVETGDIVGLIGPNGAGKSTTMKMVMNLISKDSGEIVIGEGDNFVEKIGFATESSAFYEYLSGYDNLMLIAKLYDNVSEEKVKEIVDFVGLLLIVK